MIKEYIQARLDFEKRVGLLFFDEIIERGIMPDCAHGAFDGWNPERAQAAVADNPDLHIISSLEEGFYNCFVPKAIVYHLGNADVDPSLFFADRDLKIEDYKYLLDKCLQVPEEQRWGALRFSIAWYTSIINGAAVTDGDNLREIAFNDA